MTRKAIYSRLINLSKFFINENDPNPNGESIVRLFSDLQIDMYNESQNGWGCSLEDANEAYDLYMKIIEVSTGLERLKRKFED